MKEFDLNGSERISGIGGQGEQATMTPEERRRGKTTRNTTVMPMIGLVIFAFSSGAWPGPILQAARTDNTARLKSLSVESRALADAQDPCGLRPLDHPAGAGNREAVELLLVKGAQIDARATLEQTALHLARTHGEDEVAVLLVREGADEVARSRSSQRGCVLFAERSTAE